jgi:hypothetical protein
MSLELKANDVVRCLFPDGKFRTVTILGVHNHAIFGWFWSGGKKMGGTVKKDAEGQWIFEEAK